MNILTIVTMISALAAPVIAEKEENPSIADLGFLVGEWEGRSTFYYPREEGRVRAYEKSRTRCSYILKNTYIQCDTSWTRDGGGERTLRLHLNYNNLDKGYQVLYIYDNWPRHVSYLMQYDEEKKAFVGFSNFEDSDGVAGKERVLWRPSADGAEVYSAEFSNLETDTEDYWPKYFDFTWRKIVGE